MAYLLISDFRQGVDRSRPRHATPDGAIWSGIDGHISRGGDFEKRKAFTKKYTLPAAATFGLGATGDQIYVFGSGATPGGLPAGVNYQRLQHPDAVAMSAVLWVERYGGKLYVIAQYTDGSVFHFYDGAIVTQWNNGVVRAGMTNNNGIASHMATLIQTDATYTTTVATNVVTVEQNTVNVTMAVVVKTLNKDGGVNDQLITAAKTVAAAPGVKEKWTFTITGTFEVDDRFNINIDTKDFGYNGNPTYKGTTAKTLARKVYAAGGPQLDFSGVDTAVGWNSVTNAGAGQINMSNHLAGFEQITALAVYQAKLAVFARRAIQIWNVDADPAKNSQYQVLESTGTRAPGTVRQFGDLDVFYLSDSGIRSLRARDINLAAGINDVGTLIDTLVRDWVLALTSVPATAAQPAAAQSVVEPLDGRLWMAIGSKIFVFTYFPAKKVSAWSWYEPGFAVDSFAVATDRVYARSGDFIYLYGGDDNATYDTTKVTIALPFLTAGKPGNFKQFDACDIAAVGTWNLSFQVDPNDDGAVEEIGDFEGVTFGQPNAPAVGHFTHVAPVLVNSSGGYASVSALALYYEDADSPATTQQDKGGGQWPGN